MEAEVNDAELSHDEHVDDPLPQRLGAVLLADPRFKALVKLGPPDAEPEPACMTCSDRGFTRADVQPGDPRFGKPVACECRRPSLVAARVARLWASAEAPAKYRDHTLETYPGDPDVVEQLRRWLERDDRAWLVASGEYGAGKTGLAVALLHEYAERGQSVLFVNAPSMLRRVRATYSAGGADESSVLDTLADVDVLAIDDVGKERLTDWASELLYDLVNRRYSADRRTIVTTNLSMHDLNRHVGDATFWRIYERAVWLSLSGNLRERRGRRD